MQRRGLEWLYRVIQEPRRMWKRYLVTNAKFGGVVGEGEGAAGAERGFGGGAVSR
ncbi:WecB/TagA/CpsF family glycosyltransferase [Thauera aromatica]|uniref:WecB/TagA/CpsF family glycosyltransferase n=1 Tax=Thauera aromatica TaxID=59405 RepID=UPI001B87A11A